MGFGGVLGGASLSAWGAGLTQEQVGWNEQAGEFVLPPLPYGASDLEPHIDAQTMNIHHDRHHAGYVRGLNSALQALQEVRLGGDTKRVEALSRDLAFNLGGHLNHTLFWNNMTPGGSEPSEELVSRLEGSFNSYEAFQAHFKAAAGSVKGSGWAWLVFEPLSGQMMILQMFDQQDGTPPGLVPLLGVDVWEHAYYLKYQNRRAEYIDAFMRVVNWREVEQRLNAARSAARGR